MYPALWPDNVRLSGLEDRFVCTVCGHRGADVRPLFEPAIMGRRRFMTAWYGHCNTGKSGDFSAPV
jgi:hypothetical protein